ncbi:MAG: hypothetical protein ACLUGJ_14765 [Blautia wexlerae]
MIYRTYYLSPLGRMLLAADDIGLVGAWFEGQKYFGEFPGHRDFAFEEKENCIFERCSALAGVFTLSAAEAGFPAEASFDRNRFSERSVWDILLEIPYGQPVTYGEIRPQNG